MSIKPFTDTMRLLKSGAFNHECAAAFANLVRAVEETGKAGKLTITIDVKKAGAAVALLAKVTDKTPEEAQDADLFWVTPEGNVTVTNPNQRDLPLHEVQTPDRANLAG